MAVGHAHARDRQRKEQTFADAIDLEGRRDRIGEKQVRRAHDDKRGIAVGTQVGGLALIDQRDRPRAERIGDGLARRGRSDAQHRRGG